MKINFNDNKETFETNEFFYYNGYRIYKDGKVEEGNLLPDEYQQVEYIESTGTQYIDTNLIGRINQLTNAKFEYISISENSTYDTALLGCRNSDVRYYFFLVNNREFLIGYNNYFYTGISCNSKSIYNASVKLSKDFQALYINNQLKKSYSNPDEINIGLNLYIFSLNSSNNPISFSKVKLYSLQIYNDEILQRDFIPCKSTTTATNADGIQVPANTKGLYDIVEGKFYTNANTAEDAVDFIAGPEV